MNRSSAPGQHPEAGSAAPGARTGIRVIAHPPERRERSDVVLHAGACCCCCCCCLHSLGSLVGAIAGSVTEVERRPRKMDPSFPFPYRMDEEEDDDAFPPALVYWILLLLLIVITCVFYFLTEGKGKDPSQLLMGSFISLLILPGLQLGASLLAAIVVGIFYEDRANALRRIGRITVWSFVGTLIGMFVMGGFCGVVALFG